MRYSIFKDGDLYGFTIVHPDGRKATRVGFYNETIARSAAQYFQFNKETER